MPQRKRKLIRQGDVLLIPRRSIPKDAKPVARDRGRVILAYGEVTGHAHALLEPGVELVEAADRRFLHVATDAQLRHEEHDVLTVPAGDYEVRIQKEYTPESIRNVAD